MNPTIKKAEGPVGIRMRLSKTVPEYHFKLNWDVREDASSAYTDFDLDAVAFLLGADGRVDQSRSDNMVFYNNHLLAPNSHRDISADHSTLLGPDNRRGGAEGETIKVLVPRIAHTVRRIVFATTIYDAEKRKQTFKMVKNATVEIVSVAPGLPAHVEGSFDLTHDSPDSTGVVFGQLVREHDSWHFETLALGYRGGLREIGGLYGIEFSD